MSSEKFFLAEPASVCLLVSVDDVKFAITVILYAFIRLTLEI